jgi:aryl-alcohol dehydrogenase-like predicted oxidoreductase
MQYRSIGSTGISISAIGLGCWTLGGPAWEDGRPKGWAPVDESEAVAAVQFGLDQGVNHFDNADVYGDGRAERLLAKALGSRGSNAVIASKVGHFRGTAAHAYEPLHIRRQCEQSLVNLKRDYLDIYYFHHADFGPGDCYLDGACDQMARLTQEGKIRCIGLSAYAARDFSRLIPRIRPAVVQSWAHAMDWHFIAARSRLMRLCGEYGVSFIAFSPLNQGILLGKYSSAAPPAFPAGDHRLRSEKFTPDYLARAQAGLDTLRTSFNDAPEELARVALQFVLGHEHVTGVIPGFRNVNQVRINLAGADRPLNGREAALVRKAFRQDPS